MVAGLTRRHFLAGSALAVASSCGESDAPAPPPNILLVVPDQLRYDWTALNPAVGVRTPHLRALADRGVSFENCYCPSPLCAPSRACLAGGLEYDRCGVPDNSLNYPLAQTTYYALLRSAGYHVMGCGKFDLHKPEPSWGVQGQHLLPEWGFSAGIDSAGKWDAIRWGMNEPCDPYTAHLHDTGRVETHRADFGKRREIGTFAATFPTPLPEDSYCDNWIGEQGLRLLREAPKDQPWHLAVNFAGPHEPVDITESMQGLYRDAEFPQPNRSTEFTPEKHIEIRRNYAAMIENIDAWMGRMLAEVQARGELGNTLVAFTSDHGEMLGDHDLWMKRLPRQASVGVPLVVAGPGVRSAVSSGALVSMMDLAATFLDYADIETPSAMDSRSLRPVLEGDSEEHREFLLSGLDPWRCITDGRLKLIRGYAGGKAPGGKGLPVYPRGNDAAAPLLFDIREDPFENRNLANSAPSDVVRLTAELHRLIGVG
ncbi:MAG: sulfatase-like hydrolase/transferase, partial [Bryobacterales bacterium]|nr:sulfatase-like hydrolase/transferase [Bryobacterales bacterium]